MQDFGPVIFRMNVSGGVYDNNVWIIVVMVTLIVMVVVNTYMK